MDEGAVIKIVSTLNMHYTMRQIEEPSSAEMWNLVIIPPKHILWDDMDMDLDMDDDGYCEKKSTKSFTTLTI